MIKKIMLLILIGFSVSFLAKPSYNLLYWKYSNAVDDVIWEKHILGKNIKNIKPYGWLQIEKIGINTLITDDISEKNLMKYPCVLKSATENSSDNTIILAHRDRHFNNLKNINKSCIISFSDVNNLTKNYNILETKIIPKENLNDLLNVFEGQNLLILVTCYPFKYIGSAPDRFIVIAKAE